MSEKVNITSKGIQRVLRAFNEKQAVAEYIWNGFDAHASTINLDYKANALGLIENLSITDDGYGIDVEKLKQKFDPFFESEKALQITVPKHTSKMHGRNGVGRLTFFTFAHNATWETTFESKTGLQSGTIKIQTGSLNSYAHDFSTLPVKEGKTGTRVSFFNIRTSKEDLEKSIIPYLIDEFCWFIELNKEKNYSILVNGIALDFSTNVHTREEFSLVVPESQTTFKIRYVHWKQNLHRELSKYYFLSSGEEIYKDYTTLNKKSDDYFHSVYIESDFFKDFDFNSVENQGQSALFGKARTSPDYRYLIKELTEFLKTKRKPFLKEHADKLIDAYEQEGVFPNYESEREKELKKPQLTQFIKSIYETEPKLFSSLNVDQKKVFVRLFDLLLHSDERENVFHVLDGVVDIETEDRENLELMFQLK